ncbi:hypothetical protein ACET3X_006760 [Alternaria dauci]|uniref:Transmembrane protein n=1 Tax=Alternaria dauci TaxID=48095 RepID=A0ABR3UH35_9PLEO
MAHPSGQTPWIVLPCILLSLLATRFLIEDFASPDERGLIILSKAALIFLATLIFTTKAAHFLFPPALPTQPPPRNIQRKEQKASPVTEKSIRPWRETIMPGLCWSSDSSDEGKEEVKQRRKEKRKELSKKKKERDTEKSLRKRLWEMFKPKRYEMLGIRRETIEEVVREDPLLETDMEKDS